MSLSKHTILVATPLGRNGKGGIDRMMDVLADEIAKRPDPSMRIVFAPTRGTKAVYLAPFALAGFLGTLVQLKLTSNLRLVHINLSQGGSTVRKLVVAETARRLSVPYTLHLHGSRYRQYWDGAGPTLSRQIQRMFEGAARVYVLGEVWKDYVEAKAPGAEGRIEILPNATVHPPAPARGTPDQVKVLFLGRVGSRKGTPQLIEALGRLTRLPQWSAAIAGDGDLEPMKDLANVHNVADRISFTGWVGPAEVEALLQTSDILVLPSFDENLPMSVIEAMGHGLGVIATPVGATADIVRPEETGLLIDPGDVEGLTNALERMIVDAPLRERLGSAARDLHRTALSIEPYAARLTASWRELIA